MRIIKIRLDKPVLPTDDKISLSAASYQISKDFLFETKENILLNLKVVHNANLVGDDTEETLDGLTTKTTKNQDNLFYQKVSIDVSDNTTLYVRVKYHFTYFNDGNNQLENKETSWSRALPVSENDNRLKLSSSIVSTPSVNVSVDNNDDIITITGSDFDMYSGYGTHQATSWKIEDLNNNIYFSKENDIDNLKTISTDYNLGSGKIYRVMCSYIAADNTESNYGVKLLSNFSPYTEQFSIDMPEDFVNGRKFYFRLKLWTPGFQHLDLKIIRKKDQEEVFTLKNQNKTTGYLQYSEPNYTIVQDYECWLRLTFKDSSGTYQTEWTKVAEKPLEINSIYLNRPKTTYLEKYDTLATVPVIYTNGITCITTTETYDNKVICSNFSNNTLWLYTTEENTLKQVKNMYTFDDNLDIDYMHIMQLANHDILVDTVLYKDNHQTCSVFYVFDYDPIKQQLTLLNKLERETEQYATSVSKSLVVLKDGTVWYVPARDTNVLDDEYVELKLKRYNTFTNKIDREISLPFKSRYNVGLFCDFEENIYVHCGSLTSRYGTESESRVEYYERDNNMIYKFNPITETFEEFIEFPAEIPAEAYCLHAFLRQDGKVIFLNGCHSGEGLKYNKFIVLDLETKEFTITDYNCTIAVPFRTNLRLSSGDIVRVSGKIRDPQNVLVYRSNSKSTSEVGDIGNIEAETEDLIVVNGQTVVIEDIYKYKTISIQGTGIIKWYRPQGITILTSKTYIVNKDNLNSPIKSEEFGEMGYDSVLILDGNQLYLSAENESKIVNGDVEA